MPDTRREVVDGRLDTKAFIVATGDLTETAVMNFVAERVAPHKKVRLVEFVDEIPRSAAGKILKRVQIDRERQVDP